MGINSIFGTQDTPEQALTPYAKTTEVTAAISAALTPYATKAGTLALVAVPAAADSEGTAGQVAFDATNLYVCVDTDTWVKATLATWE